MCDNYCRMAVGILLLSLYPFAANADGIPSPQIFFGFPMGKAGHLADYGQIRAYFKKCSVSPRMTLFDIGETTLGQPLMLAVISGPENLKSLDKFQSIQRALCHAPPVNAADALGRLQKIPVFVSINCSIHAGEIGPSQMSAELAYRLLSRDGPLVQKILKNVILLLIPVHNPDGLDMVVDWYKKYAGTKYQDGPFPFLYHHYCGHDINRDWFALTQKETRATVEKVYNVYRPQIVMDLHQMGSLGPRMVLPPYVDPYDSAIDPVVQAEMAAIGTAIASDLTAKDYAGVGYNLFFDSYSPGRSYTNTHGGVRILCEIASAELASTMDIAGERLKKWNNFNPLQRSWRFPKPWTGGAWSLENIVDYALQACFSLLDYAADDRLDCQYKMYRVLRNAAGLDKMFIIPQKQRDPSALYDMLELLQTGLVRVHRSQTAIKTGRDGPPGTFVVKTAQPYGNYALTLLERRKYPGYEKDGRLYPVHPYDVTSHNVPLLFGVDVQTVTGQNGAPDPAPLEKITAPGGAMIEKDIDTDFYIDYQNLEAVRCLQYLYDRNVDLYWELDSVKTSSCVLPPGTVRVHDHGTKLARTLVDRFFVHIYARPDKTPTRAIKLRRPRVGVYRSHLARKSEGWMRFVLDDFDVLYTSLTDNLIKNQELDKKYDIIILPDQSASGILHGAREISMPERYCGGIGENGRDNLSRFVRQGGTLAAIGRATALPLQYFWLGAKNVVKGLERTEYYAPGCLLKVIVDTGHPLGFGLARETAAFFYYSPAFDLVNGRSVAHFPGENILLDGWLTGEKHLALQTAVAEIPHGKGRVLLYGIDPTFRAQSRGTFKFLFNAVIYSGTHTRYGE